MAQQVKHLFIVTSAINSKFGIYKPEQRLEQTLATIQCLRERVPECKIIVMECTGVNLTAEQEAALEATSDELYDFTSDPDVQQLYHSTDNWDIVKNVTEIMCFGRLLKYAKFEGDLTGYDRIHKMSGRYLLNNEFDLRVYEDNPDKIIIGPKHKSQFPFEVTGIELQYMARLWSWPGRLTDEVIKVYDDSLLYISQRMRAGGYADIEHVLYKFLPTEHVKEIAKLGVEGNIAPNGVAINN
jgi:hypothetical protein